MLSTHTPAAGAPSVILGISAKSIHAGRKAAPGKEFGGAPLAKSVRYELLRVAQGLLYDRDRSPAQQARVVWCSRTIKNKGETVGVWRHVEGTGARYASLHTCGSVWHCPVCAAKVTEARRRELQAAMVAWVARGGGAYLLTLTFPHEADMPLAELLDAQAKALQRFKNCRTYKRIMDPQTGSAGRIGSIRSLEVTVGLAHGWHPHTHDLVFCRAGGLTERDRAELTKAWVNALLKVGLGSTAKLTDMMEHALDLRGGEYAAEYIAKFGRDSKWGASSEMTRGQAKVGRARQHGQPLEIDGEDHFTPFQLLTWAANGDAWAACRFREYAQALEGKRMLSWSPGLKTALGVRDLTDEELAGDDAPLPEEAWAGVLTAAQFQVLLKRNRLGDFLRYVAECCTNPDTSQQDIDDYIAALEAVPPTHGGTVRVRGVFGRGWTELP